MIASLISVLYILFKYLYSKETPNVKEGLLVILSSLGGLYVSEHFGPSKPKPTEVFTENPAF